MTDIVAAAVAPAVEPTTTLVKDHQAYFVKSADKVNSTLHAAICKFCHAQDVEMKDNRTCLWQARDCIRHLARCPHVTESVRSHFKEEARLLNARLNSKKRTFHDMNSKQEENTDTHYHLPSSDAQPAPPTQLLDAGAEATGELHLCSPSLFHSHSLCQEQQTYAQRPCLQWQVQHRSLSVFCRSASNHCWSSSSAADTCSSSGTFAVSSRSARQASVPCRAHDCY